MTPDSARELIDYVNACPYYRHLGFKVISASDGHARLTMPVRTELLQFQGAVHGGAIYSIADAAVAIALLTLAEPGQHAVTIEGKVNFLSPAKDGELIAEGSIIHKGRTIAVGETTVRNSPGDRLVATGLVTYALRAPRT